MIPRSAQPALKALAAQFPAVLLLGPRQCGKTTLVRHFVDARYFDLERPSDLQVFSGDIEYALQNLKEPLILDEAQTLPALFPVLRSLIDDARRRNGRFFLLGSVSPDLLMSISESLAGRVGILELTPFIYSEVAGRRGMKLEKLWLRGGYPDAVLARDQAGWQAWQESYLRTFIERDIARHQLSLSAIEVRRLLTMLAHAHGGLLNHSTLGRSMGYSYHTIQSVLDLFAGYFLIRRLQPFHADVKKRLVKASKIYLRDSGILHYLLGIGTADQLLTSPGRGNSFEGFMIQEIAALEELQHSGSAFYFYRTHAGAEIDLLIDRGNQRVGFEFKAGVAAGADDWKHLQAGVDDEVIHRGYVVYNGTREFAVSDEISVIPASQILSGKLP
jgi:predicted AAA+ superfamily ATPase